MEGTASIRKGDPKRKIWGFFSFLKIWGTKDIKRNFINSKIFSNYAFKVTSVLIYIKVNSTKSKPGMWLPKVFSSKSKFD